MILAVNILLVAILLLIAFEDFKWRKVTAALILGCFVVSVWVALASNHLSVVVFQSVVNIVIVLLQLVVVTFYFSLKHGKLTNILKQYMGLGDILLLLAIVPLFTPLIFTLFLAAVYLTVLLLFLLLHGLRMVKDKTIPLAGGISLLLAIFLLAKVMGVVCPQAIEGFVQQLLL